MTFAAVENHTGEFPKFFGGSEDLERARARQQGADMGRTVERFGQSAVVDDEMRIAGNLLGDGQREIKPPPGHQYDFDPARGGFFDGLQILRGDLTGAVEQRPVDIHRNHFYGHIIILAQVPGASSVELRPNCRVVLFSFFG